MALEGNSGLSGAVGFATEAETWGTSKAPSKWLPILPGESLQRKQTILTSSGIRAGRTFPLGTLSTGTTHWGEGSFSFEVGNQGFGQFLNLLGGQTETELKPKKEAGGAYKQVHEIGTKDPFKKCITLVKAVPMTEGGVVPSFCYPGSILDQLELSLASSGFLIATAAVAAKDENTEQSIGTVSYPTNLEAFNFTQCVIKIATVEQKYVRDFKMTITKPTLKPRVFVGSSTPFQPLTNAFGGVQLALNVDFSSKTLYEMFEKRESKEVEITFTGGVAAGTEHFELKFKMPYCRFEGDSPNIADLGPVGQAIPLKVEDNGSEAPLTVTYVSLDVAL